MTAELPQLLPSPFANRDSNIANNPMFQQLAVSISSDDVVNAQQSSKGKNTDENWRSAILLQRILHPRCACCCVELCNAFKVCGRCQVVYYCNAECQRQHWSDSHKMKCKT